MTDPKSTMERFHQYTAQPAHIIKTLRFDQWRLMQMHTEGLISIQTGIQAFLALDATRGPLALPAKDEQA